LISSHHKRNTHKETENRHTKKTLKTAKTQHQSTPRRGKIEREKGKNRVSLAHNGSQDENGLLHLIHIPSGELEHRGDEEGALSFERCNDLLQLL